MTGDPIPDPEPQTLLAEEDFLRGVIRDLIHDPDQVDDIVQQTFVQALTRPPKTSGLLRGWLARVARNKATDLLRANRRRRWHEARVPEGEALPTPAEILEREAERQKVVDAVLSVREPYRTTLLLRYYDNLAAPRIAERLDITAMAVRTRLSRGLEMLRQRLDAEHGGDRRAWMVALLPLVRPEALLPVAAATVVATTLTHGVLWMFVKTRVLIGFALVLVATVGWLAVDWSSAADPETESALADSSEIVAGSERSTDRSPDEAVGGTEKPPIGGRRALVVDDAWRLLGRVSDGRGTRLGHFAVAIELFEGVVAPLGPGAKLATTQKPIETVEVRTDTSGAFVWTRPKPTGAVTLRLTPGKDELAYGEEFLVLTPDERPPADLPLRFQLLDGIVVGRVTDSAGQAIAGAHVHWYNHRATTTDASGCYELRLPAGRMPVMCYAAGFAGQSIATNIDDMPLGLGKVGDRWIKRGRRNFVLTGGFTVTGLVRDEAGEPIADVSVHCFWNFWQPVRTGADGRFEMNHLPPAREDYSIHAQRSGYRQAHANVTPEQSDVVITMRAGATLTGRVVDPNGRPVEGAAVYVRAAALNNGEPDAFTDSRGEFTVSALRQDTFEVTACKRGYAMGSRRVGVLEGARTDDVELQLGVSRELRGVVTDPKGRGIGNAWVHFTLDGELGTSLGSGVRTDADGMFVAHGLPNRPISVLVMAKGYQRREVGDHEPGGPTVRIELTPEAAIAGLVYDGVTGKPIDEFRVRIIWPTLHAGEECGLRSFSSSMNHPGWSFSRATGYWNISDDEFANDIILAVAIDADGPHRRAARAVRPDDPQSISHRPPHQPGHPVARPSRLAAQGGAQRAYLQAPRHALERPWQRPGR